MIQGGGMITLIEVVIREDKAKMNRIVWIYESSSSPQHVTCAILSRSHWTFIHRSTFCIIFCLACIEHTHKKKKSKHLGDV